MNFQNFQHKKWFIIDSELFANGSYSHHDPIKLLAKSIESNLCDYSDAHILVTGNIVVTKTVAYAGDYPFLEINKNPID